MGGACDDIKEIRFLLSHISKESISASDNKTESQESSRKTVYNTALVEAIWGDDIRKLQGRLSKCQSDRDRLDWLDKFLHDLSFRIRRYTLKGNEHETMKNWSALIDWISPIYSSYGGEVPEEYQKFTL